jgi:predicted HTH domain antitoxin
MAIIIIHGQTEKVCDVGTSEIFRLRRLVKLRNKQIRGFKAEIERRKAPIEKYPQEDL